MTDHRGYLLLYFLALVMPSAPVLKRYLGVGGAIAYVVAVGAAVALWPRALPWMMRRLTIRTSMALGVAALIAIIAGFAVIYPRVNTQDPDTGSDRDDALNVGVGELMRGAYPYDATTYLGAPISPGPGALIQSVPFWLVGNAAYQNFFWLPVFVVVASKLVGDIRIAVGMTLITLVLSPALAGLEMMTGGDFVANSLYVLTSAMLLMLSTRRRLAWTLTAGALLGFFLSSRALYVFIVPVLLACVWRTSDWKRAAAAGVAIFAALLAISLPFYLHAPARFGPLAAQNKFAEMQGVIPHASAVALTTTALLPLGLSVWVLRAGQSTGRVMAACAIVLMYPGMFGLVLESIRDRRLNFDFGGWASCGTFFATMALAAISARPATASAPFFADRPGCS